jgi:polar amino acid transport system substrate-binding protein
MVQPTSPFRFRRVLLGASLSLTALLAAACSSGSSAQSSAGAAPAASSTATALTHLLPAAIRTSGAVTIATDAEYPPCESYPTTSNQTMIGFEPDLWNAMGRELGVRVNAVSISFDGLIPGVQSGRYPLAMECISDSAAREQQVSFVDFMYAEDSVITLKANPRHISSDPLSVCGLTVALQSGTDIAPVVSDVLSPHCVKNGRPSIHVLQFNTENATLLAVYSGRADFLVTDDAAAKYLARSAPQPITAVTNPLLPKFYLGIVISKSDTGLQQAMLQAVRKLQQDGTYAKVLAKWNVSELALTRAGINLATTHPLANPAP